MTGEKVFGKKGEKSEGGFFFFVTDKGQKGGCVR